MMKLSAQELLNKFSKNTSHAIEVRRLAMMIFDETNQKIFNMPDKYREYLETASLLHDIGYYVDSKNHNKHSLKLILENGIQGFSQHEEKIIGCICRYHRGGLPDKNEHEIYNTLEKKDRKTVKKLAGILKVSDGLDRGHLNLIKKIHLEYDKENNIVNGTLKAIRIIIIYAI